MALDLQPPMSLRCIEFQEHLKDGVTRPMVVTAVDENEKPYQIVLKVQRPKIKSGHHNQTSLACELICSIMARSLKLPVPDYAIVEISSGLPQHTESELAREIFRDNVGKNFGTVYHEGLMHWSCGDKLSDSAQDVFEDILSFDTTVMNQDRRESNTNLLLRGDNTVLMIDHSLALEVHQWPDSKIAASPCFDEGDIIKHCSFQLLKGTRRPFIKMFQLWIEKAEEQDYRKLRSFIPNSWESKPGDLDRIFRFISKRSVKFDHITNQLKRYVG